MKWIDWLMIGIPITLGLMCLTFSGMPRIHSSLMSVFQTMAQLCFWMGVPILTLIIVYFVWTLLKSKYKK